MSFWDSKIAPSVEQPVMPRGDGAAYRAERRQVSASAMYAEPIRPRAKPSIYVPNTYQGLTGYQSASRAKYDRQPGETTESWRRRVTAQYARHLGDDERARIFAAIDAAEAAESQPSHADLRQQLDSRASGTGVGIMGLASPTERGAAYQAGLQRPGADGSTFGYEAVAANQPASAAEVNRIIAERERAQRGHVPEHTDVSQLRSSGAASGWVGVDNA